MTGTEEIRKYINVSEERSQKLINEARQGKETFFRGKKIYIATYFMSDAKDKEFVKQNLDSIWGILEQGYKGIGGFKGIAHKSEFLKKVSWVKLGFYDDEIVAVDIFNDYLGGQKSIGLSCVKDGRHDAGVELVKMIIQENINNINDYTWAEVSGRVEDLYRQNGGLNIKSVYANLFFEDQFAYQPTDEYHYTRFIGGTPVEKTIFGIKDESVIGDMIDEDAKVVRNFIKQHKDGFMNEDYRLSNRYRNWPRWRIAKVVIDGLYNLYENYLYREFPEDLYRALYEYFSSIEKDLDSDDIIPEEMIHVMKECVDRCTELMNHVTVYKPFKIN